MNNDHQTTSDKLYKEDEKNGLKTYNYIKRLQYHELKEETEFDYDFLYNDRDCCERCGWCCERIWCYPIQCYRMLDRKSCFNLGEVVIFIGICFMVASLHFNGKYLVKTSFGKLDKCCQVVDEQLKDKKNEICNHIYDSELCNFNLEEFKKNYGRGSIEDDSILDVTFQSVGGFLIFTGLIIAYRKNLRSFFLSLIMNYHVNSSELMAKGKGNPFITKDNVEIDITNQDIDYEIPNLVPSRIPNGAPNGAQIGRLAPIAPSSNNGYYAKEKGKIEKEIMELKDKIEKVKKALMIMSLNN